MNTIQQQTISVVDAGRMLGVGRNVAYRMAQEGKIPTLRLGKKIRVPLLALKNLLQNPPAYEALKGVVQ